MDQRIEEKILEQAKYEILKQLKKLNLIQGNVWSANAILSFRAELIIKEGIKSEIFDKAMEELYNENIFTVEPDSSECDRCIITEHGENIIHSFDSF